MCHWKGLIEQCTKLQLVYKEVLGIVLLLSVKVLQVENHSIPSFEMEILVLELVVKEETGKHLWPGRAFGQYETQNDVHK